MAATKKQKEAQVSVQLLPQFAPITVSSLSRVIDDLGETDDAQVLRLLRDAIQEGFVVFVRGDR